jgi:hypothetical protein
MACNDHFGRPKLPWEQVKKIQIWILFAPCLPLQAPGYHLSLVTTLHPSANLLAIKPLKLLHTPRLCHRGQDTLVVLVRQGLLHKGIANAYVRDNTSNYRKRRKVCQKHQKGLGHALVRG